MPINKKYDVDELLAVCRRYAAETSRRISFEYSMLAGVNDSDECARLLASKLRGMLCHVNLIPVNEVEESPFKPSSPERIERFTEILAGSGITATVRRKLGSDIEASCGQLRRKMNKKRGEKKQMRIAARTDIGLVRENNQDSYTAGELCEGTAFAVVCDGMGGAAEGALASRSAVKVIREKLSSGFSEGMSDIAVKKSAHIRPRERKQVYLRAFPDKRGI